MNYPASYFQRLFSGMRPLEVARRFAIYSGILFFLIAIAAGTIVFVHKSQTAHPYFLYTDANGEWVVYSEKLRTNIGALPWYQLMMESLATRFAENYFKVSNNNEQLWCRQTECKTNIYTCRLFCESSGAVFESFEKVIIPKWQALKTKEKTQELIKDSIIAKPLGEITEEGGLWKITGTLKTSAEKNKKIIVFIKIGRTNVGDFPQTLGFYVNDFYFYEDK